MLPPNFKHILGCLAFSEKNFLKNLTLRRSNHFLKIQWEIHFLLFKILTETLQKKIYNRTRRLYPRQDLEWDEVVITRCNIFPQTITELIIQSIIESQGCL